MPQSNTQQQSFRDQQIAEVMSRVHDNLLKWRRQYDSSLSSITEAPLLLEAPPVSESQRPKYAESKSNFESCIQVIAYSREARDVLDAELSEGGIREWSDEVQTAKSQKCHGL